MASANPMIDKFGRDYNTLLKQQTRELQQWKRVLKPEVYEALAGWCEMVNGPCVPLPPGTLRYKAGGLHSVPINSELHHFIMEFGVVPQPPEDPLL